MIRIFPTLLLALSLMLGSQALLAENRVLLTTSKGDIELTLFPDKSPVTVANFLRYVDEGFYDNTIFHRVINGFMVQGGGFDTELQKKRTREPIINEADNGLKNNRGTVAMARTSDPNSATAQFFINHVDNDFLNHRSRNVRGWGYCVFAEVTAGMETVDAIADELTHSRNGMQNVPEQNVLILKATRL